MNSRERVYRALRFENPDRAPRDLWALAAIPMFRPLELGAVLERFPVDITLPVDPSGPAVSSHSDLGNSSGETRSQFRYGPGERAKGKPYMTGTYVDEWGCPWEVREDGVKGEVKQPPLGDWGQLGSYRLPWEILEGANWDDVNHICERTDKFVLTPWHVNPFERMQFLRGTEALFMDLASGATELFRLRDMVHEFFLKEIEYWCHTDVDGVRFSDDWGAQTGMLVSPEIWRQTFKPLYVDYCQRIHAAGKFAFMHSDGNITSIIPDLIEIGVDALNTQLFCMDIEELGRTYTGEITFWGELDRQWVLPFGEPEDVQQAVRRVRQALDAGRGGVIAQLEWGKDVPRQNVEAAFEAWLE